MQWHRQWTARVACFTCFTCLQIYRILSVYTHTHITNIAIVRTHYRARVDVEKTGDIASVGTE